MGNTHHHTHEAVKTDAQVAAEKEIKKLEEERLERKQQFSQAEAAKDNDLNREHNRKRNELKQEVEKERLAALENKKKLLEPVYLQEAVEEQALKQWTGFGPPSEQSQQLTAEQKTDSLTYADLSDHQQIASHVEKLFKGVPEKAKLELVNMAQSAMDIVKDCQEVTEIVQSSKKECGFNVVIGGEDKHYYFRYALAFRYNTVTEEKAKNAGMLKWYTDQLSNNKQNDLTTVAISYKCDVHTSSAKSGALTLAQCNDLTALGL